MPRKKKHPWRPSGANALSVLELLAHAQEGLGGAEIARSIKKDVSQVHRLLKGLVVMGYAKQDGHSARYVATPRILELAGAFLRGSRMIETARPLMRHLRDTTGESVHLADANGPRPVCVAIEVSPHPVSVLTQVGATWPLEGTAIGRAIAAFLPERPASAAERQRLAHVRLAGYAVDRSEYVRGVCGVAAPVLDWQGRVVGALAISGPAERFGSGRITRMGTLVRKAAADMSAGLGYEQPQAASARRSRARSG